MMLFQEIGKGIPCRIFNNPCKKVLTIPPSYINALSGCFGEEGEVWRKKSSIFKLLAAR
jgi:hypothetical protein